MKTWNFPLQRELCGQSRTHSNPTQWMFCVVLMLVAIIGSTHGPVANAADSVTAPVDQVVTESPAQPVGTTMKTGTALMDPAASAGKVALFLILVLIVILALAWAVQKTRLFTGVRSAAGTNSLIQTLAVQPLGVKEKIALVRVADKYLVLGITAQQVRTLAELDDAPDLPAATGSGSFADLLKKAVKA